MNIGIIVHSHTGNTLSVARKLSEAYHASGHSVQIAEVKAVNEDPSYRGPVELATAPDPTGYDLLVLAAPVRAFSLSPVMAAYLAGLPSLRGRKTLLFVTQQFPRSWMGGNRAAGQMKNACAGKGARVLGTAVVNWSSPSRERQIETLVSDFSVAAD